MQRRRPRDHRELAAEIYEAQTAGLVPGQDDHGRWEIRYAGDCKSPLSVKANAATGALFTTMLVRCRKCTTCLRARRNYWGFAAMNETVRALESGLRTWFGTLTLRPDVQQELKQRAIEKWMLDNPTSKVPDWFEDMTCDKQFALVRNELLLEIQKYWKRLRKAGHAFKYFVVFERHKSGLPHVHFLLHEQDKPIRKRDLQGQWPLGHSNVSIVGGKSRNAAAPEKAAWYVSKYLSKSYQSRQLASRGYVPKLGRGT